MELLKLVIVDDEPILLQGLLDTWSKNVWIKQKECWKKKIPVSEQSVKKLVSAILLIFHNYSSNIPENCQVSIKRNTKYEAKIFKFRYPEKIFKIYAYITSSCTFIIYDRSILTMKCLAILNNLSMKLNYRKKNCAPVN